MAVNLSRGRKLWFAFIVTWLVAASAQFIDDCPLGWDRFTDHCYLFVFYPVKAYPLAATACQLTGAHLLSVNTNEEHEFVSQWLTDHDMDRSHHWWTSGIGAGHQLYWDGDGTASVLDQSNKWVSQDVQGVASLRIVYGFTTQTNTFLWSRQYPEKASPYVCEIRLQEAYRVSQARRDHTFGTDQSDESLVPRGPRFSIVPQSLVVVGRSEMAFLECAAMANPSATYTWYKITETGPVLVNTALDPRYSLTNGRFSFQLPDKLRDSGDYFCEARNDFGIIRSHNARVSFGYLGEFSNDPPGAVSANMYQGTYIDCNPPQYNPDVTYLWYKGPGVNFLRTDLNQYLFVSSNGRLYFSETQLSDAGMFHCMVTLAPPLGQSISTVQTPSAASLGIQLVIRGDTPTEYGPIIHNDFPAVFPAPALRERELRLECFAYGKMPLYYSWRRDNGPIPEKVTYTEQGRVMLIPNAQLEDSGNYTCRVERGMSASDEKTLRLNIEAVPFFVFPLRDQHIDVGTSFIMQCQAMAVPLPTYAWFKNGQPLTSSVESGIEVRHNVVNFQGADPDRHNGMYACSATNIYGTRISSAQVRVLHFKPTFSKRPMDSTQMATVGGNTTIICQPEAAPTPVFTWFRNGQPLGLTPGVQGRVMLLKNGNLLITQVQLSDQGEYTCTAENNLGSASSQGLLTVVTQTTIAVPPDSTDVIVNGSAFLSCQASVDQRHHDLVYTWAFNGHILDIDYDPSFQRSRHEGNTGLHVINVQFRHEGWYECRAVTVDDKASASGYLTVKGPPSEPAGLRSRSAGNDIIITWTDGASHGSSVILYVIEYKSDFNPVWRMKEREVQASDAVDSENPGMKSYLITDLSPGSSYSFRVRAVNSFGVGDPSLPSALQKVPDAPPLKAPESIRNYISTVGTLAFTWDKLNPEDLTGQGKGYKLYWRKKSQDIVRDSLWETDSVEYIEDTFVTEVGVDNFYLEYEVKVAAFNSLGQGPNSSVTVIMSQEQMPVATPTNVWGEDYNSTAIMVYWDPVPNTRDTMKGKLMGFAINYWSNSDPDFMSSVNIYCDDCEGGMVLGLTPNEDYWINVQVFNSAGMGPVGEDRYVSTLLFAPILYPEYVAVHSMEGKSVYVSWRGVPISLIEDQLLGYKMHWWPAAQNMRTANETVVEGKQTWGIIKGVNEGIVYALRVLGYNAGGDGKKSPTVFFTLEGQVVYNPETTEILATGSYVRATVWLLVTSCVACWLLLW